MLKILVALSLIASSSLFSTCYAQTCNSHTFSSNQNFATCNDLPYLNSFLYWNYDQATGKLQMAFRQTGVTSSTWVSWAINPTAAQMPGSQCLVAYPKSDGTPHVYTSPIGNSYSTSLAEGNLTYQVSDLTATYQNSEMVIFATWSLPTTTATINQVWQSGPLSGGNPGQHGSAAANLNSKGTVNLLSGQTQSQAGGNSRTRKRNVSFFFF